MLHSVPALRVPRTRSCPVNVTGANPVCHIIRMLKRAGVGECVRALLINNEASEHVSVLKSL